MHKLLVTLMAEVTEIVKSHPIATIPSDPDEPQPLTPTMLLTMKTPPLAPTPGQPLRAELVEKDPVPGQSVLGEMEKGVPAKPSEDTQVNDP